MRALRSLFFAASMLPLAIAAIPAPSAQAGVFVSVAIAPPAIPVYVQPPIPGPGYVWVPGYWAYGPDGYYWVPGTWALPPAVGLLWTPGYWDWGGGVYVWHAGYWGPTVGFYGGINYGFGYFGVGYVGGYWAGGHFFYNRAYSNLGTVHVTNVYNRTVVNIHTTASYHGGRGGTTARPTPQEAAAARERHIGATSAQSRHIAAAAADPALRASVNHGRPAVTSTAQPGRFGTAQTHGSHTSPGAGRGSTGASPAQERSAPAGGTGHGAVPQSYERAAPRKAAPPTPANHSLGASAPNAAAPHSTSRPVARSEPRGGTRATSHGPHPPTNVSQPHGHAAPIGGAATPSAPHGGKGAPAQSRGAHDKKPPGQ